MGTICTHSKVTNIMSRMLLTPHEYHACSMTCWSRHCNCHATTIVTPPIGMSKRKYKSDTHKPTKSKILEMFPLVVLSLFIGSSTVIAQAEDRGDNVTLPLTYTTTELKTSNQDCPSERDRQIVRNAAGRNIRTTLRHLLPITPAVFCHNHNGQVQHCPATSCQDIFDQSEPYATSGYYWVTNSSTGNAVQQYCDFQNQLCRITGSIGLEQLCPASSCIEVFQSNEELPSGYYWLTGSNESVVQTICSKENTCNDLFQLYPELPSDHYWLTGSNGTMFQIYCSRESSCSRILQTNPGFPSGYYGITPSNGTVVTVYCDMEREGCGNTGGWTRVAFLNMTDPTHNCPPGWRYLEREDSPRRTCGRTTTNPWPYGGGYNNATFDTLGIEYIYVMGEVRGYQQNSANTAFRVFYFNRSVTIDDVYVDGLSLTYGTTPRKHMWNFACGNLNTPQADPGRCPCTYPPLTSSNPVPSFVGNDYFCESVTAIAYTNQFYSDNPLWDGQGCVSTSNCCNFNSPPYFCKALSQPTSEDLEVRLMADHSYTQADTLIERIEIYVQ